MQTWTNATQKDSAQPGVYPPLLISYGHGDGGGGPTREMLENIRLLGGFPGAPQVHFGKVKDFFRTLEQDLGSHLPTWNGELYLELHRGTYTTQARNKRANRQSEFALHDAEFLAALAARLDPAYPYPAEDLHQAWELVCLNQFHDIIPGSSIGQVYVESLEQYTALQQIARAVRDDALSLLRARSRRRPAGGQPHLLPAPRTGLLGHRDPRAACSRPDGTPVPHPTRGGRPALRPRPAAALQPADICPSQAIDLTPAPFPEGRAVARLPSGNVPVRFTRPRASARSGRGPGGGGSSSFQGLPRKRLPAGRDQSRRRHHPHVRQGQPPRSPARRDDRQPAAGLRRPPAQLGRLGRRDLL